MDSGFTADLRVAASEPVEYSDAGILSEARARLYAEYCNEGLF